MDMDVCMSAAQKKILNKQLYFIFYFFRHLFAAPRECLVLGKE